MGLRPLRPAHALGTAVCGIGLASCVVSPELDRQLLCSFSDAQGDRHVELYSYRQKVLYPIVEAPVQTEGGREMVLRAGGTTRRLFPSKEVRSFSTRVCQDSQFVGDSIFVYPLKGIVDGFETDVIAASENGGRSFEIRPVPEQTFPPVVAQEDGYLAVMHWYSRTAEFRSQKSVFLEQEAVMWLRKTLSHCPNADCPVVMKRRLESQDAGQSWRMVDYAITRPELMPKGSRVILRRVKIRWDTSRHLYDDKNVPLSIHKIVEESGDLP